MENDINVIGESGHDFVDKLYNYTNGLNLNSFIDLNLFKHLDI
jgi:hypothetical protein